MRARASASSGAADLDNCGSSRPNASTSSAVASDATSTVTVTNREYGLANRAWASDRAHVMPKLVHWSQATETPWMTSFVGADSALATHCGQRHRT
jgi:hypothetical protein